MGRNFNRARFIKQAQRKLLKALVARLADSYQALIFDVYSQVEYYNLKGLLKQIEKHLGSRTRIKEINDLENFIFELIDQTFKLLNLYQTIKADFIYEAISNLVNCFHALITQVSLINFTGDVSEKEASMDLLSSLLKVNKNFSYKMAINTSKLFKNKFKKSILHASKNIKTVLQDLDQLYKTKKHHQLSYGEKILYEIGKYYQLNFMLLVEMAGPMHDSIQITDDPLKMIKMLEDCFVSKNGGFSGAFFNADGFYTPETKTSVSFYRIEKILMRIIEKSKPRRKRTLAKHLLANRQRLYKREPGADERKSPKFARYIQKKFDYTAEEKNILRECEDFMKLESNAFKKNSEGKQILEKPLITRNSLAKEVQKYLARGE